MQISAGNFHTCALVNGSIQCWGIDERGRSDLDWFSIEVSGPGTLRATSAGVTDVNGSIRTSPSNVVLAQHDDISDTNFNFDVSHRITAAGTYLIRVLGGTSSNDANTGVYRLTVTFTPSSM